MQGVYFANPDCLEPVPRSRAELTAAVEASADACVMVITQAEFDLIKREISLAYRWRGRRVFVR